MSRLIHEHAASFRSQGDRGEAVLLLHGWTGSPAHFRLVAEDLAAHGYTVAAPLLAGHGTRPEDLVATTWRDWLRDAVEEAARLVDACHVLHVAGLSMGGLLGVLIAPTLEAASLTTINAPMRIRSKTARFAPLVRGRPWLKSEEARTPPRGAGADYLHQYDRTPVGRLADLLDVMHAARAALPRVHCPTLVLQSLADDVIHPDSAEVIFRSVGAGVKRLQWLDSSRHVATVDEDWPLIAAAIRSWIAKDAPGET